MKRLHITICLPLVLGVIMPGMAGCSKKTVQSGGETQSSRPGAAKGSSDGATISESNLNFPETSLSGRDSSGRDTSSGLRGLDKNPSEERVGSSANTLLAKADPGSAGRQMDEARAEQAASAAAGLRDVFCAYDSFQISDDGRQVLSRNAEWLKANPSAQLKVEGHCDDRGTSAYNLVLGEKRAKAVRNYLVELGVTANRLAVVSYGKERPFCKEHTEACYAQNRRGHVVIRTSK